MNCPVCDFVINEKNVRVAKCMMSHTDLIRYVCDNCQLIFGPIDTINMTPDQLVAEYVKIYAKFSDTYTGIDYYNFYRLEPEKNKKYLSVGCGHAPRYIDVIRQDGYNLIGQDIILDSANEYLLNSVDGMTFDGIISNNYIEHVQDPIKFFHHLNAMLGVGNLMIHSTACFEYMYEESPMHLYFLSIKSLRELSKKTGFVLEKVEKFRLKQWGGTSMDNCIIINNDFPLIRDVETHRAVFRKTNDVS